MAKAKTSAFFCQNCGYESSKWMGQCPACREWNTFVEELVDRKALSTSGKIKPATEAKPVPLSAIKTSDEERISTSMPELDRVLGGGVVKGSLVLVGGDPGIGKSTLLLQVCRNLSGQSPCSRSNCVQSGLARSVIIWNCCVRPVWTPYAR